MPSQLPPNHPTQFGFWNTAHDDDDDDDNGGYAAADSSFTLENEKHMSSTSHTISRFDAPNLYFNQPHAFQITLQNHTLGSGLDNNTPILGDHYENGLFSSSLSDIFTRKLRLSANDNSSIYGHSVGASHYEEEPFESLEEIEAQTIGNLLPDDDDLLSGVTDGLDCKLQPAAGGDVEDLDFFSSVGGMELGEDGGGGQRNYETSATQQPSRTLFVRNIDSNVDDSELRILFEQYGEIHTLYTASKHRGFVMISYYDIRATKRAMQALQNKPLRSRKLDIHYSLPKDNPSDKDINQGTVTIYNLDSSVSNVELRHVFGAYGEVKEIHDGPQGSRHKSIEFYDIRAAETALRELHKSDIGGKQMKLVSSYAGASKRLNTPFPELNLDETSALLQMCSPPTNFTRDISGSVPNVPASVSNNFSSITGVESGGLPSTLRNQRKYDFRSTPNYHPQSLPEYHDGLINSIQCNSPSSMAANLNGRISERVVNRHFNRIGGSIISEPNDKVFGNASYMWNPSHQRPPHNMIWPNSPSLMNGVGNVHSLPRAPSNMANNFLHIDNHHVGSAPSVNPSIWDRRKSFIGESPDASVLHSGSPGNMRFPGNSLHPLDFVSHNMFPPRLGGNSVDLPIPSRNIGLAPHHQNNVVFPNRGQMLNSFDSPSDRARSRRNEGNSNQADSKKQFELDLDRIMRGEDRRTTLMIKNIPNKYTSKMLLAAIDERHRGTYDFIYLPIDFKNKCNVGYAFINMTEPTLIIPFYQAFNGKKWEKFNSEKVASIAYARIQGKAALIAHFQNSSLMNEDKRCRPILFHTDGPNAGDQVPFPMGVNVRLRVNKNRNSTNEEDVEAFSNGGDSSSGSAKDFE